jgi:phenylalanyl-tRNA synthetase beta chain
VQPHAKAAIKDEHPVVLEDPAACPRFAGRVVRNIDGNARSPTWMTERLRRVGLRPIHPVVDVTNYVMMELGQPLHAYDLAKLQGPIRPRFAKAGERVVLLDEKEVRVREDTVVITDDSGVIGLAGMMGGLSTMVTDETTDVLFEAAFWPRAVMAGRARSYGMHTDASLRFERGVDPQLQAHAVDRAAELLVEIAGGRAGPLSDHQHTDHLPIPNRIELRRARLAKILGAQIPDAVVEGILQRLGLAVSASAAGWVVETPSFRFDLEIEEDLIEEVARIYGYDQIPETTAVVATPLGTVTETRIDLDVVANTLVSRDYQEVVTYSFVDAKTDRLLTGVTSELVLANPISSEMSVMRGSLWSGMLTTARTNVSRQQDRVRLFEIGKSFHGNEKSPAEIVRVAGLALGGAFAESWSSNTQVVDFFDIKSDVYALLTLCGDVSKIEFAATEHCALQPGQAANVLRDGVVIAVVGKLHPAIAVELEIKKDVFLFELNADKTFTTSVPKVKEVSKYPAIRRDIAVVVRDDIAAADLLESVATAAPGLIKSVTIFDVYRGAGIEAGLKSVALGLILQETSRTLTDDDADSAMDAAVRELQDKYAAVLRD